METIALVVIFIGMLRNALIAIGLHKAPILRSFERYGSDERPYLPLLDLILWVIIFIFSLWVWLVFQWSGTAALFPTTIVLGLLAYVAFTWIRDYAIRHVNMFIYYPRWYRELHERTTREERRRIAYMWLCLPLATRMRYNAYDKAFLHWVDLVLVSSSL